MDLDNLIKIEVLLPLNLRDGLSCRRDGFSMTSVLVCMVTHWTWPMVNYDIRLSGCHDSSSYYVDGLSNLRGYWACVEINWWLWPMGETLKWSYIPYRLGHYWWRLVTIGILNRGIMIPHGIKIVCLFGWSKGHAVMKSMSTVVPLMEFDICFFELEYVSWLHNKRICKFRIGEVILMGL